MDDDAQPLLEKLLLLRRTPKDDELLADWNLNKDFGDHIIVNDGGLQEGLGGPGLAIIEEGIQLIAQGGCGTEAHPQCCYVVIV